MRVQIGSMSKGHLAFDLFYWNKKEILCSMCMDACLSFLLFVFQGYLNEAFVLCFGLLIICKN